LLRTYDGTECKVSTACAAEQTNVTPIWRFLFHALRAAQALLKSSPAQE